MIIQESYSSYLFNFETKFLEKPMNSSPIQRVSDCKAAGFSLLA